MSAIHQNQFQSADTKEQLYVLPNQKSFKSKLMEITGLSNFAKAPGKLYDGEFVEGINHITKGSFRLIATAFLTAITFTTIRSIRDSVLASWVDESLKKNDYSLALRHANQITLDSTRKNIVLVKIAQHCFQLQGAVHENCLADTIESARSHSYKHPIQAIFSGVMHQAGDYCSQSFNTLSLIDMFDDFRLNYALEQIVSSSLLKGDYECAIEALPQFTTESRKHESLWKVGNFCIQRLKGADCAQKFLPYSFQRKSFLSEKLSRCILLNDQNCIQKIETLNKTVT